MTVTTADTIDYSDVSEICGYQLLLRRQFEAIGGFVPMLSNTHTIRTIQSQGLRWLSAVKEILTELIDPASGTCADRGTDGFGIAAIPELLSGYDYTYRMCNREPDVDFIRKVRRRAIQRWIGGDRRISQTAVVLLIADEIDSQASDIDERYSQYYFSIQGEWIDELNRYNRFQHISPREAYQRLNHLLNSDLSAYVGHSEQHAVKCRWTKANIESDLTVLDTQSIMEYISFLRTARIHRIADTTEHITASLAELATRPDLHPFYQQILKSEM